MYNLALCITATEEETLFNAKLKLTYIIIWYRVKNIKEKLEMVFSYQNCSDLLGEKFV